MGIVFFLAFLMFAPLLCFKSTNQALNYSDRFFHLSSTHVRPLGLLGLIGSFVLFPPEKISISAPCYLADACLFISL
jgi:hypothetical protein